MFGAVKIQPFVEGVYEQTGLLQGILGSTVRA